MNQFPTPSWIINFLSPHQTKRSPFGFVLVTCSTKHQYERMVEKEKGVNNSGFFIRKVLCKANHSDCWDKSEISYKRNVYVCFHKVCVFQKLIRRIDWYRHSLRNRLVNVVKWCSTDLLHFLRLLLEFYTRKMLQDPYKRAASHRHLCNSKPVILLQPLPRRRNDCFFMHAVGAFLCKTVTLYIS